MTLTNRDGLVTAINSDKEERVVISKNSITTVAGRWFSYWTVIGTPAAGSAPTTAALCTSALTGSLPFTAPTSPDVSYIVNAFGVSSTSSFGMIEIWDRLVHMGGLSYTSVSAQTVGADLATLAVPSQRLGAANYSDVQWYMETYSASGATASNHTINVTYHDGSTGNLTTTALPVAVPIYTAIPLTPLIPAADQGKFIKGVNNVTLSASTGTAGNFGFTCVRPRTMFPLASTYGNPLQGWAQTGLPDVPVNSCLQVMYTASGTSMGINGYVQIARV